MNNYNATKNSPKTLRWRQESARHKSTRHVPDIWVKLPEVAGMYCRGESDQTAGDGDMLPKTVGSRSWGLGVGDSTTDI